MGRGHPGELRARTAGSQTVKYTGIVQAGFPVGLLLANLTFLFTDREGQVHQQQARRESGLDDAGVLPLAFQGACW